jgi:hypothetical protein
MTLEDLDKWDAELVRVEQIRRRSSFVIGVSVARDLLRLARERLEQAKPTIAAKAKIGAMDRRGIGQDAAPSDRKAGSDARSIDSW